MSVQESLTVAEIASKSLAAVRVFETLGIDYCCGGKRPLEDVCRAKGYDPNAVKQELEKAINAAPEVTRCWITAPLWELVDHIVNTHHAYLKRELPALSARLEKVYSVYNQRYGETLPGLPEIFANLRAEIEMHLQKEERILFPAIAAGERAVNSGDPLPRLAFGRLDNPISILESEHESAGEALAKIREITQDFHVPPYGCVTYRALMSGLKELEEDLHMHVHLENNVLFPRALHLTRGS